jgi:Protein of unknown function (DUF2000)
MFIYNRGLMPHIEHEEDVVADTTTVGRVIGYTVDEIRTDESTRQARLKWVVAVDRALATGQAVNAAACVAAATGEAVPGLLGPGGSDGSAVTHPGLPWAGCSILGATSDELSALRQRTIDDDTLLVVDMPASAQTTRVYDEYLDVLGRTATENLELRALSIIGPRNRVAKLVKHLGLLS